MSTPNPVAKPASETEGGGPTIGGGDEEEPQIRGSHWGTVRAVAVPPVNDELLRLLHLRLESLQSLQAELPHAAHEARLGGKHSAAYVALLKDIGETMEIVQEKLIKEAQELVKEAQEHDAKAGSVLEVVDEKLATAAERPSKAEELRAIVPVAAARRGQRVALSHVTDTCMELFNEAGDLLFAAELWSHQDADTAEHEARWLFWLAVVFMLLTTVARLVIARLVFWPRVREDKRWRFVFYTAVYVMEPASGQQLLKRTLRDHEDGGLVYIIGQGYVQTERDAVAVRAANELVAGRAEVRTVLALVGSEDAPGFAIQLLFLLLYSTGLSYIWYLSTAGTVLHMTRQAMGAYSTWRRLPALERMAEGRDKTFDPGVEADDTAVTDFAKEYGTAVRVVSLARKFDSPGAGFSDASLHSLVCHCPNLRGVNLGGCKNVTAEAVVALATHCAQLQSVDLISCENVTAEAVQEARAKRPSCQWVH